jgi:hypothetical protein
VSPGYAKLDAAISANTPDSAFLARYQLELELFSLRHLKADTAIRLPRLGRWAGQATHASCRPILKTIGVVEFALLRWLVGGTL